MTLPEKAGHAVFKIAELTSLALPPILHGRAAPAVQKQVEQFYASVAAIFERWVSRRESPHTRRAYRDDVMAFMNLMDRQWPDDAIAMLSVSLSQVLDFRQHLFDQNAAPKTINRRISSLSGFFKFLGGAAAELRLPIIVPNPTHAQYIPRSSIDARKETRALTATRARQQMAMPSGDTVLDYRDRAILRTNLYSGIHLSTECRFKVSDFHQNRDHATLRSHENIDKRRTIGVRFAVADAITEYLTHAGIASGPILGARKQSRSEELSVKAINHVFMNRNNESYLCRLPGATHEVETVDGTIAIDCAYTPHSLRATTATLLIDAGVDITKVQSLLGHRLLTTTQFYDKRRRATSESASHLVPI